jgi:hypothetical protein
VLAYGPRDELGKNSTTRAASFIFSGASRSQLIYAAPLSLFMSSLMRQCQRKMSKKVMFEAGNRLWRYQSG